MPFPVDEKFIEATEKKIGARFPDAYRAKMLRENGGEFQTDADAWEFNPVFDTSDRKRLSRTCNDILRETEAARRWRGWPDNAVSIAQNGFGDHLVFLILEGGQMDEKVYFWWHETGELKVLAPTFEALANTCL